MSEAITRGVRISVDPQYLPDRSDPARNLWMHAYHVTITNEGEETVKLVSRHWIITNNRGEVEQVKGPGVVGEQPILKMGDVFTYTSGCPMDTPVGTMHGSFQMLNDDGFFFDAEIAPFALAEPFAFN